ncbi:hypothetical protein CEXT_145821 [Caerostris extrusa]|uniref:Uncharacterized protein n=1 Tax=Caerostris extrusa TaxID=172846 RepID=A0AAV4WD03_CAEEX|nr:hypothetical protein CEXT_145821 [Caerostris extrusa]
MQLGLSLPSPTPLDAPCRERSLALIWNAEEQIIMSGKGCNKNALKGRVRFCDECVKESASHLIAMHSSRSREELASQMQINI